MPTITETEDHLRSTLQAVASSVRDSGSGAVDDPRVASTTATPLPSMPGRRSSRRSPALVVTLSFLAVLVVGGIGMTTRGGQPATTMPSPAEESSEPSATAFWATTLAEFVDSITGADMYGFDDLEPESAVVDQSETGDPFGAGGSMTATAVTADGQITVRAEYLGRGEAIDDEALQAEISELAAANATEHVQTVWVSPETDYESSEIPSSSVQVDYFITEVDVGSSRITAVTPLGRLVVDVQATDPSQLLDENAQMALAAGMNDTALDLIWNPDHPLSTDFDPMPRPTAADWIALDDDIWVASVDEGEYDRLWFKTDIEVARPAEASDIRAAYVSTGSHFVVIVIGQPVPGSLTVSWDDGSIETAEPEWNTDLEMGFARFESKDATLLYVDGI